MSASESPDQSDVPEQEPTTAAPPVEYATVREALQNNVEDERLASHANRLYREGANEGDGGTAAAVHREMDTGEPVGGSWHHQKAEQHSVGLGRLDSDSSGLSRTDREIAGELKEDLDIALARRQAAIDAASERGYGEVFQPPSNADQTLTDPSVTPVVEEAPVPEPEPEPTQAINPPGKGK